MPVSRDVNRDLFEALDPGDNYNAAVSTASVRVGPIGKCTAIRIATTTNTYFKVGGADVVATTNDPILPVEAGIDYFNAYAGQYIAFLRVTADGVASVTEMQ